MGRYLKPKFNKLFIIYYLLKVHKSNVFSEIPIRPVVAFNGSPTYELAKWLNTKLKNTVDCSFNHTVSNNLELVNKIKDINIPENSYLISLDISNLFTNIPIEEVVEIIKNKLSEKNTDTDTQEEIIILLKTCLNQNFFNFNGITYCQKDGLSMGSPLSPLLADIFMDNLENEYILKNNPFTKNILYYYRYVDDILCLWNNDIDVLKEFLSFINSLHQKINFTLEIQNNNSINFLDLKISNLNKRHVFDIYRKPSHTGVVIDNTSFHPVTHKIAAFRSFVNRAVDIPLSQENFNKEVDLIKDIARSHNYNVEMIDTLINKKKLINLTNLAYIPTETDTNKLENLKFYSLTFNGAISYKIHNILSKYEIKIAFKSKDTTGNFLINNKDKINPLLRSGVYQLNCHCGALYIGRTKRSFNVRFKEHYSCIRKNNNDSLFSKHILETGHITDINKNFKILQYENKLTLLNNFEIIEILKAKKRVQDKVLNAQVDVESPGLLNIFVN